MEENNDKYVDSSEIIARGSLDQFDFTPKLTPEIFVEIKQHGIKTDGINFTMDQKTPAFKDFTPVYSNSEISIYTYQGELETFTIFKYVNPEKTSYTTLCGNKNHRSSVVIFSSTGQQYCLCQKVVNGQGDLSLIFAFIFKTNSQSSYFSPIDKCLGPTLKQLK